MGHNCSDTICGTLLLPVMTKTAMPLMKGPMNKIHDIVMAHVILDIIGSSRRSGTIIIVHMVHGRPLCVTVLMNQTYKQLGIDESCFSTLKTNQHKNMYSHYQCRNYKYVTCLL